MNLLYIHCMFTTCSLYVHYIFIISSLYVHCVFAFCSLYVYYIFTICSLYIHYIVIIYSLYIHYIFSQRFQTLITSLQTPSGFTKRQKLVHNGGFSKFKVLYCSRNTVRSIKITKFQVNWEAVTVFGYIHHYGPVCLLLCMTTSKTNLFDDIWISN